jgi:hypothetical protein
MNVLQFDMAEADDPPATWEVAEGLRRCQPPLMQPKVIQDGGACAEQSHRWLPRHLLTVVAIHRSNLGHGKGHIAIPFPPLQALVKQVAECIGIQLYGDLESNIRS